MGQFQIPAIVCAGGHGKVMRPGFSKLGDILHGKPILVRVVENIKTSGFFAPIVVVVNPLLGDELKAILDSYGHTDVVYASQSMRRGAANAVLMGLKALSPSYRGSFLTVFGEMPFIEASTMHELARIHVMESARVSFLSVPYDPDSPFGMVLSSYTFLKKGWKTNERACPFLRMYSGESPVRGDDVLGSVYVFDRAWFTYTYSAIKPMDTKNDGYGAEIHLPPLVQIAVQVGDRYCHMSRLVPEQILGINNVSDYMFAHGVETGVIAGGV